MKKRVINVGLTGNAPSRDAVKAKAFYWITQNTDETYNSPDLILTAESVNI